MAMDKLSVNTNSRTSKVSLNHIHLQSSMRLGRSVSVTLRLLRLRLPLNIVPRRGTPHPTPHSREARSFFVLDQRFALRGHRDRHEPTPWSVESWQVTPSAELSSLSATATHHRYQHFPGGVEMNVTASMTWSDNTLIFLQS